MGQPEESAKATAARQQYSTKCSCRGADSTIVSQILSCRSKLQRGLLFPDLSLYIGSGIVRGPPQSLPCVAVICDTAELSNKQPESRRSITLGNHVHVRAAAYHFREGFRKVFLYAQRYAMVGRRFDCRLSSGQYVTVAFRTKTCLTNLARHQLCFCCRSCITKRTCHSYTVMPIARSAHAGWPSCRQLWPTILASDPPCRLLGCGSLKAIRQGSLWPSSRSKKTSSASF